MNEIATPKGIFGFCLERRNSETRIPFSRRRRRRRILSYLNSFIHLHNESIWIIFFCCSNIILLSKIQLNSWMKYFRLKTTRGKTTTKILAKIIYWLTFMNWRWWTKLAFFFVRKGLTQSKYCCLCWLINRLIDQLIDRSIIIVYYPNIEILLIGKKTKQKRYFEQCGSFIKIITCKKFFSVNPFFCLSLRIFLKVFL